MSEPTASPAADLPPPAEAPPVGGASRWRLLALAALIVASLALAWATGVTERFSKEGLRAFVLGWGAWGALAFVAVFCVGELLHIPGFVFVAVAVLVWGPAVGGGLGYVTALLSVSFTFVLVRGVGGQPVGALRWAWARRLLDRLDAHPVLTVTVLRTIFQMNPAVNYALALSAIRYRDYLAGSALGLVLPIVLFALGSGLLLGDPAPATAGR